VVKMASGRINYWIQKVPFQKGLLRKRSHYQITDFKKLLFFFLFFSFFFCVVKIRGRELLYVVT